MSDLLQYMNNFLASRKIEKKEPPQEKLRQEDIILPIPPKKIIKTLGE